MHENGVLFHKNDSKGGRQSQRSYKNIQLSKNRRNGVCIVTITRKVVFDFLRARQFLIVKTDSSI